MEYVRVDKGYIVEGPCLLPEGDGYISGLSTLSIADLELFGWLPVIDMSKEFIKQCRCHILFLIVRDAYVLRYIHNHGLNVPSVISRRQLCMALAVVGMLAEVEMLMFQWSTDVAIRKEWLFSHIFGRQSQAVVLIGLTFGMSDRQLDLLFMLAIYN